MSDVSMSSIQSWSDAFHALRAQAEANRAAITAPTPDSPDAFTFPRATGQDVLAVSVAFDATVRAHAPSTILQRWLAENDLISTQSPWTLADPYVGNRSYWSTLALVVIDPKCGKPREVPLSNLARQAFAAHRHTRGERVFCDVEGRPFKTGIMLSKLWRMCRLAKLRRIGGTWLDTRSRVTS
jgi:hypothetical protein